MPSESAYSGCPKSCDRRLLIAAALAVLISNGCSLIDELKEQSDDDEIVHCEPERATDVYFSDAIHFNASQQRWVFHNWVGSATGGGCNVHINVHDGQITLTPYVRQAITTTAMAWKNAIASTGVNCEFYLHFESQSEPGSGVTPHIDLEFVGLLDDGAIAGLTVVTVNPVSRQFSQVGIQLASDVVSGNDTLAIPESHYPALIAHELGHALGMLGFGNATGHSSESEDVMFPTPECSALSAGDIATMRELYTRTPYYTPATSGALQSAPTEVIRITCK